MKDNQNAKSIVSGIIDGTGTVGAATGPLVVGIVTDRLVRGCDCTELSSLDFPYFYTFYFIFGYVELGCVILHFHAGLLLIGCGRLHIK